MFAIGRTVRLKNVGFVTLMAACVVSSGSIWAQGAGDERRGRAVAREVCAQCHAVESFPAASPIPEAPSFHSIVQRSEMTEAGLYMAIRTPHDDMPSLVPDMADLDSVMAYIWSLQERER